MELLREERWPMPFYCILHVGLQDILGKRRMPVTIGNVSSRHTGLRT